MLVLILAEAIALVALAIISGIHGNFTYEIAPSILPLVFEGVNVTFNLSLHGITEDVFICVKSSNEDVFQIVGDPKFPLRTSDLVGNNPIPVTIYAKFIGVSDIEFDVQTKDIFSESPYQISNYTVTSGTRAQTLKLASTYLLLAWLGLSYATMGTTMKWSSIKPRIYRPHGIIIGITCQFIIMPLLSFLIAKGLGLESRPAVGLVLVGTCPGGWLSNVFTALLNCDLVLSIAMTFFSTVLALGLMPLNLHIYARPITMGDEHLEPPFKDLIIQLAALVVPVFVGIIISYKFPKAGEKISKLVKPSSALIIIVSIGAGIPANLYILRSPAKLWLAAALLPMIGGLLGFFIAKVTCLANKSAVTVALETGSQNSFLAISIATLSYQQPDSDLISLVPILVAMVTLFEGSAILAIYLCMSKFPGRSYDGEGDLSENGEEKSRCLSLKICNFGGGDESREEEEEGEIKDVSLNQNGNLHSSSHDNPAYRPSISGSSPNQNGNLHPSSCDNSTHMLSISGNLASNVQIKHEIYV